MLTIGDVRRPKYAPVTHLMMYLTEDCNLRCTYCFVDKKKRRMSVETARQVVDFFLAPEISGAETNLAITFFGGEPFLELDLMREVIAHARQCRMKSLKRIRFTATTNGTLATSKVEELVREARMSLLVSMDGEEGATAHRPFVSGRSSYDLVARNLPKLVAWASRAVVRMTFHPGALDLVGNLERVLQLGAREVGLFPVVESDWNGHEEKLEHAFQQLADWYVREALKGAEPPLVSTTLVLRQHHYALTGGQRPPRPCGVGFDILSVDPDGNVMPCHRFLYRPAERLGNVSQPALSDRREKFLHIVSRDILGCDSCVANQVCGGGCRAVVLDAGGDLQTGSHPAHCLTTRAHFRAVARIYETLASENPGILQHLLASIKPLSPAFEELVTR